MPTPNDSSTERRTRLNRDRVLDAGAALADAEGIGALTMRRLGKELGVEAMALYNHVHNKDDLLHGMLDRVAGEIELPDSSPDWRDHVRRRAISAHAVLMRHPWAAGLWTSSINLGPARMRYMDSALRSLDEAGFPPDLLDRAFHTIEDHIVGHALQALGFPLDHDQMMETGEEFLRTFPVDEYPDLAAHIRHHLQDDEDGDGFEFGLDLILDGLERRRSPS
ncbi:TetR/AcrR family transcriptional regulator C-terminal domain-containing protein [Phytoactinopolyspora endophytica]|uniref:TetR/AcrR family transcriptional regulator C-terminal domain-containing protein n=1 Tax=Phytoactinopolyspora endophytica TaxID=1642495 RepID=UPI00197B9FCB|nr:TetR/AcrR family transcriptional regulator C-terminal domain-containing protein [Phytoactinopolyspora endophytica]